MASGTIKTGTETQSGVIGNFAGGDIEYYWDKTHRNLAVKWGAVGTTPPTGELTFQYPSGLEVAFPCSCSTRDKALFVFNERSLTVTVWDGFSGKWDLGLWTLPTK